MHASSLLRRLLPSIARRVLNIRRIKWHPPTPHLILPLFIPPLSYLLPVIARSMFTSPGLSNSIKRPVVAPIP